MRRAFVAALATASLASREARADPPKLEIEAGEATYDPSAGAIDLRGGYALALGRFRLRGDHLHVARTADGADVAGDAHLALCGCARPPIGFAFARASIEEDAATFALPRIEAFGVPVFALPWLRLVGPSHVGLLAPSFAVRGSEGAFLGSGVHVPLAGDLDVSAGGYFRGGADVGATWTTKIATTHVEVDAIDGARVIVAARGAIDEDRRGVAWDVDALRGPRALTGTADLAAATRPYDTGRFEASLRPSAGAGDAMIALGATMRGLRGADVVAAGPHLTFGGSGALDAKTAWDLAAIADTLASGADALTLLRSSGGVTTSRWVGPLLARLDARERSREAMLVDGGGWGDVVAGAGVELSIPLTRAFGASLVHTIAPAVEARAAIGREHGEAFVDPAIDTSAVDAFAPVPASALFVATGLDTTLGRAGGAVATLAARFGAFSWEGARASSAARAELVASAGLLATRLELATIDPLAGASTGYALLARTRVGAEDTLKLETDVAAQGGDDPRAARALATGALAWLPGDELAWLDRSGVTGGAGITAPIFASFRAGVRADADLVAGELVAVAATARYRDPCRCLGVELLGSRRVGREGVDVLVAVDLSP